ncbi:MAG: hypothetical protein ACD_66C00110G0002 [uncultured bacterium]|nr:MAG: hypothetical protein ACD_66C00110G0002 [uncultured bacterium]
MVFPNPTSSANMAPLDKGERNANSAASIWCGFKSTCAFDKVEDSFSKPLEAQRLVSS